MSAIPGYMLTVKGCPPRQLQQLKDTNAPYTCTICQRLYEDDEVEPAVEANTNLPAATHGTANGVGGSQLQTVPRLVPVSSQPTPPPVTVSPVSTHATVGHQALVAVSTTEQPVASAGGAQALAANQALPANQQVPDPDKAPVPPTTAPKPKARARNPQRDSEPSRLTSQCLTQTRLIQSLEQRIQTRNTINIANLAGRIASQRQYSTKSWRDNSP